MCTMDYSKFIVSNQKEEAIGIQKGLIDSLFGCMHSPRIRTIFITKTVLTGQYNQQDRPLSHQIGNNRKH